MAEFKIDLSTEEEIELRFNQICTYFTLMAHGGKDLLLQEFADIAEALKDHFCHHKDPPDIEGVNPVLMDEIPTGTVIHVDSKQKISAVNIMFQEDCEG